MIYSYSFTNFQCFRESTTVDLTLTQKVSLTNWMHINAQGERLTKLAGVMGSNGSGKTVLLKPITFVSWFISQSFQSPPESAIPVMPHFATENAPTEFSILFEMDGKLWRYELRCTREQVLFEALYQKRERFNYVFIREWNNTKKNYVIKQKDFHFTPQEAQKVRANASLIATAAQYGVPLAQRLVRIIVTSNISFLGRVPSMVEPGIQQAAQRFLVNQNHYQHMVKLLSSWDLGLSDVELLVKEVDYGVEKRKIFEAYGKHKHNNIEYKLPFTVESSGTRTAFVLLSLLFPALDEGGIAIIDEIESDLHPHMLEPILDLFANPKTNPHNAQLLFTCHSPEILNLLDKSQIFLVQKDENCESSAYRLDTVEGIRNDDNLYAKYMAGRYGAIPNI